MNKLIKLSGVGFLLLSAAFANISTKEKSKVKHDDGSELVCKILSQTKQIDSCYKPDQIRKSKKWKKMDLNPPIPGSIAVWGNYMAVFDPFQKSYLCSRGRVPLTTLEEELGKPEFYMLQKDTANKGNK